MFKRYVAKRKLKNKCIHCNKEFSKGDVYYKERIVKDYGEIISYSLYKCPKCKYEIEQHVKRLETFKTKCSHPQKFIETEWDYIPRESVKEPKYQYCRLCGKII